MATASSPATWAGLLARVSASPGASVGDFGVYHRRFAPHDVDSPIFGPSFLTAAEVVIRGCMAGQGTVMRALWAELAPRARRIAEGESATFDHVDYHNLGALAVLGLEEAMGWGVPAPDGIATSVGRLVEMPEFGRRGAAASAWAVLAFGTGGDAARVLARVPDPEPGPHDWQLALARALEGGPAAPVLAGWRDDLDRILARAPAIEVPWAELLWAARCVHVRIGGGAPEALMAWLRAEIA